VNFFRRRIDDSHFEPEQAMVRSKHKEKIGEKSILLKAAKVLLNRFLQQGADKK